MKLTTKVYVNLALFRSLFLTLFTIFVVTSAAEAAASPDVNALLSLEGSFFHPRREKFRELYGQGFPVLGARLDFRYNNTTWICLKSRFVKMSEFEDFDFWNVSLGLLLKKDISQERNINFYGAIGLQLDYRRISVVGQGPFGADTTYSQIEWSPSLVIESGLDFWLPPDVKISPHVDFTYFPFGDPTRGDFGDTGGFYFTLGLGFRL